MNVNIMDNSAIYLVKFLCST